MTGVPRADGNAKGRYRNPTVRPAWYRNRQRSSIERRRLLSKGANPMQLHHTSDTLQHVLRRLRTFKERRGWPKATFHR